MSANSQLRSAVAAESLPVTQRRALRAIAVFEAFKGVAALAAVIGILDLMHHDVRRLAIALIGRFGLDPAAHYPSVLLICRRAGNPLSSERWISG